MTWFGGEPLLAKEVIYRLSEAFIARTHDAGIAYTANIITNGYLLTPIHGRTPVSLRRDGRPDHPRRAA